MPPLNLFFRMTKVDEAQRLVYGIATAEVADHSGEICDYEGTKPYYEKWSAEVQKASGGKSLGNVREMHDNKAVGKITQMNFNDELKQIEICSKCVDDSTWNKIIEGVLTGYSHGGSYVKSWKDPQDPTKTRYIADPMEVSYVDMPCLATATFEYIKADGTPEMRKFTTVLPDPAKQVAQKWTTTDGQSFEKKTDAIKAQAKVDADAIGAKALKAAKSISDALDAAELETPAIKQDAPSAEPPAIAPLSFADVLKNSKAKLKKGMYDVSRAADLLSSMDYLHDSIEFEAAMEEDGSTNPDHLKSILQDMASFVRALCEEETAELMADKESDVMEMAAAVPADLAGGVVKFIGNIEQLLGNEHLTDETRAPIQKRADLKAALEKKGARHSKADAKHIAEMQDHVETMGEHVDKLHKLHKGLAETADKMGETTHADHAATNKNQVAKLGKHADKMEACHKGMAESMKGLSAGTAAPADKAAEPEDLTKAVAKADALESVVGQLTGTIENLQKRLVAIEAQPSTVKRPILFAVEKGNEIPQPGTESDDAPVVKSSNPFGSGRSPEQARAEWAGNQTRR